MASSPEGSSVSDEDAKLVTLARSTRARNGAPEGAAVRDDTGRTYAASTVSLRTLPLTALQAAVAAAVSSGARSLEAAAVVSEADALASSDLEVVAEFAGQGVVVLLADPNGAVRRSSKA